MASRRARLRQHPKRQPIPELPPIDWQQIAADLAKREQPQPQKAPQ